MQKKLLFAGAVFGGIVNIWAADIAPADATAVRTTPAATAKSPVKESVVATVGEKDASVQTVPLPKSGSADKVMQALELGIDIKEPEMKFNDVLLLLSKVQDVSIIVAPELSAPEKIIKTVKVTTGRVVLREYLNQVCMQMGASWALDSTNAVVISESKRIVLTENADPGKVKINVDFAKVPLANAAAYIAQQTGVTISVAENIRSLPIEVIVNGWEAERLLNYIAHMYDLRCEKTAVNSYNILK